MGIRRTRTSGVALCLLAAGLAHRAAAQQGDSRMMVGATSIQGAAAPDPTAQDPGPQDPIGDGRGDAANELRMSCGYFRSQHVGDYTEVPMTGGLFVGWRDVEIRALRGILHLDREAVLEGVDRLRTGDGGLPRRGPGLPPDKRLLTPEILGGRMQSFLAASRAMPPSSIAALQSPANRYPLRLFRNLYVEGGVSVVRGGVEVIRAERLTLSPVDDRAVIENATLRLVSTSRLPTGALRDVTYTVRGERIVKQGRRYVGTDLSVTTSRAGKPHFEVFSGETEIVEAGDQFVIRSRANTLVIGGIPILPLPDTTIRTGEQNQFLVQGASASYSQLEGVSVEVELGSSFNDVGGSVHSWLTGRNPDEFRGDWRTRLGWIEERGYPLGADFTWRGGEVYEGSLEFFHLDDDGLNLREIGNYLDGNPVVDTGRNLVRGKNRIHFTEDTKFDLYGDWASDPAVLSEFYRSDYRNEEIPESGFELRSRDENRYLRIGGRWNLSGHSYDDSRRLTPTFVEAIPFARATVFSEPLFETPWQTPVLLTSATELGQFRTNYDDSFTGPRIDDRTLRVDQRLEIAAPFYGAGLGVRPYVSAQFTHFDHTAVGGSDSRWALEAGVRLGSRLHRTWSWAGVDGEATRLRHVVAPSVTFSNRWHVSGEPADFHQFDATDALDERASVRVGILNILQGMSDGLDGAAIDNALWLDLEQEITPISSRDNNGHHLGLLEYELIVRPDFWWAPVPNLRFLIEGEHDWNEDRANTFNTALRFGPIANLNPFVEFRTDHATSGSILYGATSNILGRWSVTGSSQYDLELDEVSFYGASLVRNDLDWTLYFSVGFDNISEDTTFSMLFEPNLGGLFSRPGPRYLGGRALYGPGEPTDY